MSERITRIEIPVAYIKLCVKEREAMMLTARELKAIRRREIGDGSLEIPTDDTLAVPDAGERYTFDISIACVIRDNGEVVLDSEENYALLTRLHRSLFEQVTEYIDQQQP